MTYIICQTETIHNGNIKIYDDKLIRRKLVICHVSANVPIRWELEAPCNL